MVRNSVRKKELRCFRKPKRENLIISIQRVVIIQKYPKKACKNSTFLVECKYDQTISRVTPWKQNTILPTLIQKLLFDDSQLNHLKALLGYGDTERKCTVEVTALYLISAALHEWKSSRHSVDAGVRAGLPKIKRSTLSKKDSHLDFHVMKELFRQTVKQCNCVARRSIKIASAGRFNDRDRWKDTASVSALSWRALRHQAARQLNT